MHQADREKPFYAFVDAVEKSPEKLIISSSIFSEDLDIVKPKRNLRKERAGSRTKTGRLTPEFFSRSAALNNIDHD